MKIKNSVGTLVVLAVALSVTVTGCSVVSGPNAVDADARVGTMALHFDVPPVMVPVRAGHSAVELIVLRLVPDETGEPIVLELETDGDMASTFVEVGAGTWSVEAELYDSEESLVAVGEGTAVVLPGSITEVNLQIELVNGGLDIDIEWDEAPPLYVADVSHRPIAVEISGVGTYMVSGLSRIGWDIEVIEFPLTPERTIKEPGTVSHPDVALLYLRGTAAEVESLSLWAESSEARNVTVILEGIGGETAYVNLFNAVPVSANTEVLSIEYSDDVHMGGVRVRYDSIELGDYTGLFRDTGSGWTPYPGQLVEIEGVQVYPGYEYGVLQSPAPGEDPAFWLPNVYPGNMAYDWAEYTLDMLAEYGSVERRAMSVIDLDEDANETGRVNIFEVWPAGINVFNPEKPYGETFLIDLYLVGELAEEA